MLYIYASMDFENRLRCKMLLWACDRSRTDTICTRRRCTLLTIAWVLAKTQLQAHMYQPSSIGCFLQEKLMYLYDIIALGLHMWIELISQCHLMVSWVFGCWYYVSCELNSACNRRNKRSEKFVLNEDPTSGKQGSKRTLPLSWCSIGCAAKGRWNHGVWLI